MLHKIMPTMLTVPPVSPAGMPTNNDTIVCPTELNSCYYLITSAAGYTAQRSKCQALGGEPVQWCVPARATLLPAAAIMLVL